MFEIATDPARRLVRLCVTGMLKPEDVAELYRQEHSAIRAMGCVPGEHYALADVSQCPLQIQRVVEAFQKSMDSPTRGIRLAIVTGGSLSRMQARRLAKRENAKIFSTTAEAEAWLFARPAAEAA